jgi:2Fe-2S ferredoxin
VDAEVGSNIMQVATSNGIPGIEGACGGFCSCATCHVYVESSHALPPPKDDEHNMLEGTAAERKKNSRLGCQIVLTDAMNGLTLRMPGAQ